MCKIMDFLWSVCYYARFWNTLIEFCADEELGWVMTPFPLQTQKDLVLGFASLSNESVRAAGVADHRVEPYQLFLRCTALPCWCCVATIVMYFP